MFGDGEKKKEEIDFKLGETILRLLEDLDFGRTHHSRLNTHIERLTMDIRRMSFTSHWTHGIARQRIESRDESRDKSRNESRDKSRDGSKVRIEARESNSAVEQRNVIQAHSDGSGV